MRGCSSSVLTSLGRGWSRSRPGSLTSPAASSHILGRSPASAYLRSTPPAYPSACLPAPQAPTTATFPTAALAATAAELTAAADVQERSRLLLGYARRLPAMPEAERTDANRVMGCTAQVGRPAGPLARALPRLSSANCGGLPWHRSPAPACCSRAGGQPAVCRLVAAQCRLLGCGERTHDGRSTLGSRADPDPPCNAPPPPHVGRCGCRLRWAPTAASPSPLIPTAS